MNTLSKKIIPITVLSISTFAANAASLYVAPNGSNDNDGSQNNPFATISHASTKAQPGDKVVITAGTYFEHVQIQSSGLSGQPITYVGEAGSIVDGSNVQMDHDDYDGLFVIAGQSYIIVDGITVKNTNHHGISVNAGNRSNTITDVTIKNSRTENTDGAGIIAYGSYPFVKYQINNIHIENNEVITPQQGRFNGNNRWHEDITIGGGAENFVISGNHVENIPSQGIYVDAGKDGAYNIEVYQNRVHGISGYGVIVGGEEAGEVDNVKIHNNIIYNTGWSGVMVDNFLRVSGSAQDKTNIHIFNNTLHNTGYLNNWAGGIQAAAGTSGKVYNNIIDVSSNPMDVAPGNYEVTNNCVNNAPGFVDAANADFHLQSSSPCLNAGASISETTQDDSDSETETPQSEPNDPPSTSLTTPTAIAPQGEITELSPTYQWKVVAGATSYTLGMEDPVTETGWREFTMTSDEANCSDVTQPCTYTPQETLTTGDKIAWWIKAINTNGETPYVGWGMEFQVISSNNTPPVDTTDEDDSTDLTDNENDTSSVSRAMPVFNHAYQENYSADKLSDIINNARNAYVLLDPFEDDTFSKISAIKNNNNQVAGYISAGTGEDWRNDYNQIFPYLSTIQWEQWQGEGTGLQPFINQKRSPPSPIFTADY